MDMEAIENEANRQVAKEIALMRNAIHILLDNGMSREDIGIAIRLSPEQLRAYVAEAPVQSPEKDREDILQFLAGSSDDYGYTFTGIMSGTGITDRARVRRACRVLARRGYAVYVRGLWSEDGEPCGAGYGITIAGRVKAEGLK
jgi:hypothetical protein